MDKFLIVVMDIGQPDYIDNYFEEISVNETFISYLNQKLLELKNAGSKIVFSNYLGSTHSLLTVIPDIETTDDTVLADFINKNLNLKVVYTGFHYPVCTHNGRPTSSHLMKSKCPSADIYVCPFLTRPLKRLYGNIAQSDNNTDVKQIML